MTQWVADPEALRRRRLVRTHLAPGIGACRRDLAVLPATQRSTEWTGELVGLLRSELQDAARRGIITGAESEQLLARLVLVIDQGLATG